MTTAAEAHAIFLHAARTLADLPSPNIFAIEHDRQCRSVGCLFELQPKSNPTVCGPLELEKGRFDLMMIQPGPHLGHGGAELGATAPDLNNVHAPSPPSGLRIKIR